MTADGWEYFLTPGGRKVLAECLKHNYPVENNVKVPALGDSGIKVLAEYIKERIDYGFDCLILVTGDRGAGKSTVILQTGLEVNKNLTVDSIAFRIEDFARILNTNKPGRVGRYPQVILDEAGHALFAQDWMNRAQRTIAKEMIINRINRQIAWMAVPKRSQLNNQLRDMPYIWIHVQEPQAFVQGYAQVLTAPGPIQSMWHPERYWVHQFVFTFSKLEGLFWDQYEKAKLEFVNKVTEEMAKGKRSKADVSFDAVIHYLHEEMDMSWAEIARIPGVSFTPQVLGVRDKKKDSS
jgi:hypothetical protein